MSSSLVIGVDIGGSHISAAVIDCKMKSIVPGSLVRQKVNAGGDADEILQDWSSAIKMAMDRSTDPVRKIGIAMPGPFDYDQGISYMQNQNKFDSLYKKNVRQLLAEMLETESEFFHFSNDAACFLQGEIFASTDPLPNRVAGFTFGTGFGSSVADMGIAVDADLWSAPFKGAIAEDYLSTRWFVDSFYQQTGKQFTDVLSLFGCREEKELVARLFASFGENLAAFIMEYYPRYNWKTVILGGNISQSHALFKPALEKALKNHTEPITIKISQLGESATLVGAAGFLAQLKMV